MTNDERTILLCAAAALLGYWWAKRQPASTGASADSEAEADPLAWLGEWAEQ